MSNGSALLDALSNNGRRTAHTMMFNTATTKSSAIFAATSCNNYDDGGAEGAVTITHAWPLPLCGWP